MIVWSWRVPAMLCFLSVVASRSAIGTASVWPWLFVIVSAAFMPCIMPP
jgi:hypothetical protein